MPVPRGKKPTVTAGSKIPKLTTTTTENQVREHVGLSTSYLASLAIRGKAVNKATVAHSISSFRSLRARDLCDWFVYSLFPVLCAAGGRPTCEEVLLPSSWSPEEEDCLHRHH